MPSQVHKSIGSSDHMTSALKAVQSFTSQTVRVAIDDQMRASEIIKLQTFLSTQSATNPPSNKKFDPAKINKDIMDQDLQGRIIDIQNAANLT
jgi:hypothetical protein